MNELFFEPKTTQYGSHMIMSNVHKSNKTKYINIDTKFREEYNYSQISNYNIILPERITEVKSMRVVSAEIPMTFFNISSSLGNNYFYIYNTTTPNNSKKINIPDGQYNTILFEKCQSAELEKNFICLDKLGLTKPFLKYNIIDSTKMKAHNPLVDAYYTWIIFNIYL
jgi:hypothetical protein